MASHALPRLSKGVAHIDTYFNSVFQDIRHVLEFWYVIIYSCVSTFVPQFFLVRHVLEIWYIIIFSCVNNLVPQCPSLLQYVQFASFFL